ncbi:MAG: hypothetical protein HY276_05965 [Ignavibacteriales bacterium]|nr:hypothetical protein [Ignavibacteriales bacterium]
MKALNKWHFTLVFIVCIILAFLYGQIPYTQEQYKNWDLIHYMTMAGASPSIATSVEQPFNFRLLGPFIAGLLPLSIPENFYILTTVSILAFSLLLYFLLLSLDISSQVSALTVTLFAFNKYLFGLNVWDYFQLNDILALIALIILLSAMYRFNWKLFGIVLLIGSITRETTLLIIPVAIVYLIEKKRYEQLKWVIVSSAPGIITFFIVRLFVPHFGGNNLFVAFTLYGPKFLQPETLYRLLINSFAPFTLLPVVFWSTTREWLSNKNYILALLALVLFSTLFGENAERLMAPAALAFYPLLAYIIQKHLQRASAVALLMAGALLALPHHQIGRFLLPNRTLSIILSITSLILVTTICFFYRLREDKSIVKI